ncbi:UNVERIFIED_CONTAM: Ubiquitin-conjugating enzyme E2 27 [Siphonaria sp. JEL0065]|nr:Ubiquitin-conjugating enzyme E2 27 [Siphonaria sp. JEL0065]
MASARIKKEIAQCMAPDSPVKVEMVNDSITHLKGSFKGPSDTPYEGGIFEVDIETICLDILKDQWSPVLTLKTALISLQSLMSDAAADNPQDAQVANHYLTDRAGFDNTARQWTKQFAGAGATEDPDYIDPSVDRTILQRLVDMGFDRKVAAQTLKKFSNDENRAIEALLG